MSIETAEAQRTPVPTSSAADEADLLRSAARRRRRRFAVILLGQVAILAALIVGWQLSSGTIIHEADISSPSRIYELAREWLDDGSLMSHIRATIQEAVLGFVIGAVCGALSGIVLGVVPAVGQLLSPYVNALYALPKIVLGPLFVLWFGIAMELKVVLAAIFVYFLVLYNTWTSIREVEPDLVNVLRLMGAKRGSIVLKVMLPSAVVWLFLSLRISFPLALIGATLGELLASNRGLGYVVNLSASQYDSTGIWVAILALVVVSVFFDRLLWFAQGLFEKRYGRSTI
jgi:NitT/TauT family transport system permease protein